MVKSYDFEEKNNFSKKGVQDVYNYLKSLKGTIEVKNVEEIKNYQQKDIDLIWNRDGDIISIEVKTDRYSTGNFFLETISNNELKTKGCFLKSEAKYFYYYFPGWDLLYILPLKESREWFLKNIDRFEEKKTTTHDGKTGEYRHTTVGRIVPIQIMLKEVKGIELVKEISKRISN